MGIEQIPADELVTMTELWHRAFNAAGCNPMCHCCFKLIPVNEHFKLATISVVKVSHPIDLELKLKQREGKVITDETLWNAHDITMRYESMTWGKGSGIIYHRGFNLVTYLQYINNKERGFNDRKSPFIEEDEKRWKEVKDRFFNEASREVMLCATCTTEEYQKRENEKWSEEIREYRKPKRGGCFRVNGKIVH
jgi:hypothetical protein